MTGSPRCRRSTLLAVDGNSLLHRSFHAFAGNGLRTDDGRPDVAVRGVLSQPVAAADRVCADAVVVGFDDPTASVRRERWPLRGPSRRQATRARDPARAAVTALRELGSQVVVPPGLEADDVLASAAAYAPTVGARTVVVTSDRDSFALIGEHARMLRILNGGVDASPLLDEHRLVTLTGVRPDQHLDYAALRGMRPTTFPGCPVRPKTTARLLAALGRPPQPSTTPPETGEVPERGRRRAGEGARDAGGACCLGAELRRHDDGRLLDLRLDLDAEVGACRWTRPRSG